MPQFLKYVKNQLKNKVIMKVIPIELLLNFFMKQQKIGYQGINFIIAVMEDDFVTQERKIIELENAFEVLGLLNPIKEHVDSSSNDLNEMSDIFTTGFWDSPLYDFTYHTGFYHANILNGVVWFDRCLN